MAVSADFDPELAVIEAIRRGDRQAFEGFLRRQSRWVSGVIFGVLGDAGRVDDVGQQVWLSVWRRIGDLREVRRWRPWLYRLARNAALDAGRELTRQRAAMQQTLAEPVLPVSQTPPDELMAAERQQLMFQAIRSLPALYREPFVLRHLEGWSYRQIGELLDLRVDTVETRLVRARRLLREMLQGKV
ncbi:MAG: RNA polymerase sigma factor [bacterium]|nr:RNA polymerase sigma factor [bacterium]